MKILIPEWLLYGYLGLGMCWAWLELRQMIWHHACRDTRLLAFLSYTQAFLHLVRMVLTWPIYIVEDFTIWAYNEMLEADDE